MRRSNVARHGRPMLQIMVQALGGSNILNLYVLVLPSGELLPEEVIKLLKQCNPPVGWGILCPRIVAYRVSTVGHYSHYCRDAFYQCTYISYAAYSTCTQKMMDLNMPLVDEKVTFHATLFGLVKTSLDIGCSGAPSPHDIFPMYSWIYL